MKNKFVDLACSPGTMTRQLITTTWKTPGCHSQHRNAPDTQRQKHGVQPARPAALPQTRFIKLLQEEREPKKFRIVIRKDHDYSTAETTKILSICVYDTRWGRGPCEGGGKGEMRHHGLSYTLG